MTDSNTHTPVPLSSRLEDDDLRAVTSMDDALRLVSEAGAEIEDYSQAYGTGFAVLPTDEKNRLIKVPFVILEWRFSEGDNGEFVSALIVTDKGEKLVLNDGSTGIRDQLRKVTENRISRGAADDVAHRGLSVPGGLRVSEYDYTDESTGKTSKARTYYLAN